MEVFPENLYPVDKLRLLAPYIALTSTIIVTTAATAIYVKRVKRRKGEAMSTFFSYPSPLFFLYQKLLRVTQYEG